MNNGHSGKYPLERKRLISPPKALKTYLTRNSLSSQQLVEKFLEKKVSEQVRRRMGRGESGYDALGSRCSNAL